MARVPGADHHEYRRHGTVSLLAGIDLVSGKVHALVRDRHRGRDPAHAAIKLILDNHSAHISKETKAWSAATCTSLRIHLHANPWLLAHSYR